MFVLLLFLISSRFLTSGFSNRLLSLGCSPTHTHRLFTTNKSVSMYKKCQAHVCKCQAHVCMQGKIALDSSK